MRSQTLLVAPTLRISSPLSPMSVPSICVSLATETGSYSDTPSFAPSSPEEAITPRSTYLLPPPSLSPHRRTLVQPAKKGLDPTTFEGLLAANRERAAKRSSNAADRLRREVVVKAHHSKQVERRALFLSKISAPPSPTSTETAVTPPESPAVFHFTLPSPGLASPLELFESVRSRESWIEHVDYTSKSTKRVPSSRLPSLDQITARLGLESTPVKVEQPARVSRVPDSIRASTRVRSGSPPEESKRRLLMPQTIPALRINGQVPDAAPAPTPATHKRHNQPDVVKQTNPERRAAQGRNMVNKLRWRISAPAEMQGSAGRGAPAGGF